MKTTFVNTHKIERKWYVFDAKDQTLGRFSTQIANILRGKHKPSFSPNHDNGDYVVIINAEHVKVTGKKESQKTYYSHSKYAGGLKSITLDKLRDKNPEKIIFESIKGMIPRNRLRKDILSKLKIYTGETNPHEAQKAINLNANE
jgi:large subunit ribosomal protein L13